MTVTVLGVFDQALAARRALEELRDSLHHFEDVSIISRETTDGEPVSSTEDVSASEGATVGAIWGGLVGLGALLIPGVGPFIAGGALFAAVTGAVTGAVVGGITAALVDFGGIPEAEAREYEKYVHAGNTLIVVKASDETHAAEARRVLAAHGAGGVFENQDQDTAAPRLAMYESGQRIDTNDIRPVTARATSPDPNVGNVVVSPGITGSTRPTTPGIEDVQDRGGRS